MTRALLLLLLTACNGPANEPDDSADPTYDTDAANPSDDTDTTDPSDDTDTTDPGDDTDVGPSDDTDPPGLLASDLTGFWYGHNPVEACYAFLLRDTTVQITATADDAFTLTDGTISLACTIDGDDVTCPPTSGVTTLIPIAPGVYCDWPYDVEVTLTNASAASFDASVTFSTRPSPTSTTCATALSVCSGAASGQFARVEEPTPGAGVPVKAMVSR
jgi:hypothetical protein